MENKYKNSRGRSEDAQRVAGEQDWEINMIKKYKGKPDLVQEVIDIIENSCEKVKDYLFSIN